MRFQRLRGVLPGLSTTAGPVAFMANQVAMISGHRVLVYAIDDMSLLYNVDTGQDNHAIAFHSATTLAVSNFNNQKVKHIDLTGPTVTDFTTDYCRLNNKAFQQAGDTTHNRSVFIAYTTKGTLGRVADTPASSIVTPGGAMSAVVQNVVIWKPGSSNFYVGSNDGKVHEVSYSGTISQTITLPTTIPNSGSGPTHAVCNLATDDGSNLWVSTRYGFLFHYDMSGPTLKGTYFLGSSNSGVDVTTGLMLSNIVGNLMLVGYENSAGTADGALVTLWDVSQEPSLQVDEIWLPDVSNLQGLWIDSASSSAIIVNGANAIVMQISGLEAGSEIARLQNPVGTDLTNHTYRLVTSKEYRTRLEREDDNIAGSVSVACARKGENYTEIAVHGTPGVDEIGSIRRFKP